MIGMGLASVEGMSDSRQTTNGEDRTMTAISYFIRIETNDGYDRETVPLTAQTDIGARRQAKAYLEANSAAATANVSLMFYRASDGFTGEIDR